MFRSYVDRSLALVLLLAAGAFTIHRFASARSEDPLTVEPGVLDVGTVYETDVRRVELPIRNHTSRPIQVERSAGQRSCSAVDHPQSHLTADPG